MKKISLFLLIFLNIVTFAQEKEATYTWVEKMPEFNDSGISFEEYIKKNLHYPNTAKEDNLQGNVYVKFIINKEGKVQDVEIDSGIREDLDNATLEVIKNMPKWKPGEQDGEKVNVIYRLPIAFK